MWPQVQERPRRNNHQRPSGNIRARDDLRHRNLAILLAAAALLSPLSFACGGDTGTVTAGGMPTNTTGAGSGTAASQDRAAQLAAQTQLRNAQTDQESYYTVNRRYAATSGELRTVDPHLNTRVQVTNGSSDGYEMSIIADDSAHSVFIIRKAGGETEQVDGKGNPW